MLFAIIFFTKKIFIIRFDMLVLILTNFLILNIFKTSLIIYFFYSFCKTTSFFTFLNYFIFLAINLVKSITFLK